MKKSKLISIVIFLTFLGHFSFAQNVKNSITLNWNTETNSLEDGFLDPISQQWFYVLKIPVSIEDSFLLNILNESKKELLNDSLSKEYEVKQVVRTQRGQKFLIVQLSVQRKQNGISYQLEQFSYTLNKKRTTTKLKRAKRINKYKTQSELRDGELYKIAILKDGMHKITYNNLVQMFGDRQFLSNQIKVLGNGTGELPIYNSDFIYDDLVNNTIEIIDGNDGVIDPGDFIRFYARDAIKWEHNENNLMFHTQNSYSDTSYYFIKLGSTNTNKISLKEKQTSNRETSSYLNYQLHEKDLVNLLSSGRSWYGELFDFTKKRDFEFNNVPEKEAGTNYTVRSGFVVFNNIGSSEVTYTYNSVISKKNTFFKTTTRSGYPSVGTLKETTHTLNTPLNSGTLKINISFNKPNFSSKAWLDYIELNNFAYLKLKNQFCFRDTRGIDKQSITKFIFKEFPSNGKVWDVTLIDQVKQMQTEIINGQYTFTQQTDTLREFIAFVPGQEYSVALIKKVNNQNIHADEQPDLIIVVPKHLAEASDLLADFHRQEGLKVASYNLEDVYNEFSSGTPDVGAIRSLVRMFYKRANGDETKMPRYLCLFGSGTFDNKEKLKLGNNLIPTYQSKNSLDPLSSYVSDDYFALLDDDESFNNADLLDISVGRIIVRDLSEAKTIVNKILHYAKNSQGNWKSKYALIADDKDYNVFFNGSESMAQIIEEENASINIEKIYFDAYQRQSNSGGTRYPDVEKAIDQLVSNGVLVLNYQGHGGVNGWAHERVLTKKVINAWKNYDKQAIILSATCEFTRFDDGSNLSAGELCFLNQKGGAVALLTTTRPVFINSNSILNREMMKAFMTHSQNGRLGDIVLDSKNGAIRFSPKRDYRNFTLIGDPALKLSSPIRKAELISINNNKIESDTLKALSKVKLVMQIQDENGTKDKNFNGKAVIEILDKSKVMHTLGNDPESTAGLPFKLQKNRLFKGVVDVIDGEFSTQFIVPKDIDYKYGFGRVTTYFYNDEIDGQGFSDSILVGGISTSIVEDSIGPNLKLFLNDEKFGDGSIVNQDPMLIVNIQDNGGINSIGTGIGHDIEAILDNDYSHPIKLNDFYISNANSFQEGKVKYQLKDLTQGSHSFKIKAWDVYNNSNEETINFIVASDDELVIEHVMNYPNPFTTSTEFIISHNKPSIPLKVTIQIFTISGKLVKGFDFISQTVGNRISPTNWDGYDQYGQKLAKGVYIYKVKVEDNTGLKVEKFEKLVLLK